MSKRVAIYPGSFDPPTLGHIDLIERAAKIFDSVIVAVAANDEKTALFTEQERVAMLGGIAKDLDNVTVGSFNGLTAEFARKHNAIALIRGLRAISDFEFELSMAINNQKLNPGIDTVSLMPSEAYLFLSSRMVKEVARLGGELSHFVTPEVEQKLRAKMG